jgi:hypothetical protein
MYYLLEYLYLLLEQNLAQCHFVYNKSHMTWDRTRAALVGSRPLYVITVLFRV